MKINEVFVVTYGPYGCECDAFEAVLPTFTEAIIYIARQRHNCLQYNYTIWQTKTDGSPPLFVWRDISPLEALKGDIPECEEIEI